jgi:flagellar hook-associated protein 2
VRTIQRQLQDLLTGGITGIADGQLGTLAELGIQIADQTGKLEFVESRFDDLVDQGRYDEVKAVFLSSGSASNAAVRFVGSGSSTIAGVYAVTVTQAAERADLNGSNAITALGQDENLTIALNGGSATVALTAGDDVDTVVSKINTELNRQGVEAAAYADVNGVLHLRAADYGSAYTLTVVSDVAAAAGTTTGFGTTLQEDTGVDVAGQIDGVDAVGDGQVLTAGSGTDAQGLMVQIYATAESVAANGGNFGTVGYSQGAADRFLDALDGMRDPLEGTIQSVQKGYDESIKVAKERIDAMQLTLAMRRETLVRQFSAAEAAISQLQAMMASLQGAF